MTAFADAQGEKLYYEDVGTGPPLVLLHAGVADSRMWDPQVAALRASHRVLRCDLAGYGRSPIPDGAFAYHDAVADLLDHCAIDAAWFVGASFGASVAVDVCLAYPERVLGLVLAAPILGGYERGESLERFAAEEDRLLEADDLDTATELNVITWVDGPHRSPQEAPREVRALVSEMQRAAFEVSVPEHAALRRLDPPAMARLDEIRAPTLIVVGELDVGEVVAHSEELAASVATAHRMVLPGVAHIVSLEAPEAFNRLVLDFVRDATAGAVATNST